MDKARSPRIVPGWAWAGLVAPIVLRTTCHVPTGPSTTASSTGLRVMCVDEALVKGLPHVLAVVATSGFLVEVAELGARQAEATALQAPDYLADEPSFDGVRLADDQGAFELFGSHKGARIAGPARSQGQAEGRGAGGGDGLR